MPYIVLRCCDGAFIILIILGKLDRASSHEINLRRLALHLLLVLMLLFCREVLSLIGFWSHDRRHRSNSILAASPRHVVEDVRDILLARAVLIDRLRLHLLQLFPVDPNRVLHILRLPRVVDPLPLVVGAAGLVSLLNLWIVG